MLQMTLKYKARIDYWNWLPDLAAGIGYQNWLPEIGYQNW
jgi:hypothetical protein